MTAGMQVVILAGGLATRLRPLSEKIPKSMVMVNGKPFIEHQINLLKGHGFSRFVLCVGYKGEMIESFLRDGTQYGVEIRYSYDGGKQLGTGGALIKALNVLEDEFFVIYGDSYLRFDYGVMVEEYRKYQNLYGMMAIYNSGNPKEKNNVKVIENPYIYYDKFIEDPEMKYIDYGASILSKKAFMNVVVGAEFDLAMLYHQWSQQKLLVGFEVKQRYYEVGSFAGIDELSEYLSSREGTV